MSGQGREPAYKTSTALVRPKDDEAAKKVQSIADRKVSLRADWIRVQMQNDTGQEFFHELIFERDIPSVGLMGLLKPNLNGHLQTEGVRAFQACLNEEVRRAARPSDYAAMIMRPLGGVRPGSVTEEERMKS